MTHRYLAIVMLILPIVIQAVHISPSGQGQVLIFPYYTVNGGNDTLITIVNHTKEVKAAKVLFRDSRNGRVVYQFNLYLGPFDTWAGALTDPERDEIGVAVLASADSSCSVPSFSDGELPSRFPFARLLTDEFDEIPPLDLTEERTRSGFIQVIEMGRIDESIDAQETGFARAAVLDGSRGEPAQCQALQHAWSVGPCEGCGAWREDPSLDLAPPGGGLSGQVTIINVREGTQGRYQAVALDHFFMPDDGSSTLHSPPEQALDFDAAREGAAGAPVRSVIAHGEQMVISSWPRPIDAISALFMHASLRGEFNIQAVLNAETEWVVIFPTRHHYVQDGIPVAPFASMHHADALERGEIFAENVYSRTGEQIAPFIRCFFICDDSVSLGRRLSGHDQAQVMFFGYSFIDPSPLLGSLRATDVSIVAHTGEIAEVGWADISFSSPLTADQHSTGTLEGLERHVYTSLEGHLYYGLPAIGLQFSVVQNGTLRDRNGGLVLSNYMAADPLLGTRRIELK